jgi:gliding motility-associated-like protein
MNSSSNSKLGFISNFHLASAIKGINKSLRFIPFLIAICILNLNTQTVYSASLPSASAVIDLNDTIFIDVSNAIVGNGFIDYPVYINSDDPIQSMDFQFFFNNAEFTFNSIINVAGIEQVLGNVAPDAASGGFIEFRFTSNDLGTVYPNETNLVFLRFNTSSTVPCELNIVINQFSVIRLATLNEIGNAQVSVPGCSNPLANAGEDQNICATSTTLQGNAPSFGAGTWTLINGSGVIQDINSPNTLVSGLTPGTTTFRWTMPATGNSPATFDDVVIFRSELPSTSNAGENQTVCLSNTTLNAETPAIGTGFWSVNQGSGTFEDETSPFSGVSGLTIGDNIFIWTITNGTCPESNSQVVIFRRDSVFAGIDQTICAETITLGAAEPTEGTGQWSVVSGSGSFADPTLFNTEVSNLSLGENVFQWTVSGINCQDSTDQVSITIQCNIPPIINSELTELLEDGEGSGNILDNGDIDPDGTTLLVNTTPIGGPSNGTIIINGDGSFTYTPNLNYYGQDTVLIEVCDQGLPLPALCATDTLFVNVLPVNDPPTVQNENVPSVSGNPTLGNVLLNDSDIESTTLSASTLVVLPPSNGIFEINSDGSFTYTSTTGFIGFDTVIVSVCDSGFPLPSICVNDTIIFDVQAFSFEVFAGDDKSTCDTLFSLSGSEIPAGGSGLWTQIAGAGIIVDPTNAETEIQGLQIGENIYVWSVTLNSLTLSDTVIITVNPPAELALVGPDIATCLKTASISATAPANDSGSWSIISGVATIVTPDSFNSEVVDIEIGTNVLLWTVSNGLCTSTDTLVITRFEQPIVNAGPDTSICARDLPIELPISVSGASEWTWNLIAGAGTISDAQSTSPVFTGLAKTENIFTLSAENGVCFDSDTLSIIVYSDEDPFCQNQEIYIPTGFSPNGDGSFDLFVISNIEDLRTQVQIFNRWGILVYENLDYNNDWDGTATNAGGGGLPDGTYYFVIQIEGENEPRTGTLTIWR